MNVKLIYLAAGNSRRFGRNKLLYELDGKAMYRHLLERLVRICERHADWEVIVVTQYEEILQAASEMQIQAVYSPDSVKGASWSVRAGVEAAVKTDAQACVFFVADQPYLTEESTEKFLEMMEKESGILGCVTCGEQTGNPVWFSKTYFRELMELEGDQGGKKVFRRHQEDSIYFQIVDERELKDIDRLE